MCRNRKQSTGYKQSEMKEKEYEYFKIGDGNTLKLGNSKRNYEIRSKQ
jgi:hypothetical protein